MKVTVSLRTLNLTDSVYDYLLREGVRESAVARRLREFTAGLPMARMQISPEQGAFMQMLVRMLGARHTLEIGTFTGYSALVVAEALGPGGKIIACDVSEEWTSTARRFWAEAGVADRIELHLQPALSTLNELLAQGQSERMDFAFIDADKTSYDAYYEGALKLLRRGGVLAVDNALWSGAVADPAQADADTVALRTLNRKIRDDARVDMVLLPIGDGLVLARKR